MHRHLRGSRWMVTGQRVAGGWIARMAASCVRRGERVVAPTWDWSCPWCRLVGHWSVRHVISAVVAVTFWAMTFTIRQSIFDQQSIAAIGLARNENILVLRFQSCDEPKFSYPTWSWAENVWYPQNESVCLSPLPFYLFQFDYVFSAILHWDICDDNRQSWYDGVFFCKQRVTST